MVMKYGIRESGLLLAGILVLGLPGMAMADPVEKEADLLATEAALEPIDPVRAVIESQLKAFRHRDADAAYSYASTEIKEKYNDPRKFLRTMRYTYGPLYEHVSYKFLDSMDVKGTRIQKVELIGADGKPVTALYKLVKDENGKWMINGYLILETDAQPT